MIREIFKYRELLVVLIQKELKVRYKHTSLGFLWAVVAPILHMSVLWVIFEYAFRLAVPRYPLFLLTGLVPWMFFSQSLIASTSSLVDHAPLLKKVKFPSSIIPLSVVGAQGVHALLALAVLWGVTWVSGGFPGSGTLSLAWMGCQAVFVAGLALVLAVAHVQFRDVKYLLEAGMLLGFYATPIIYPVTLLPEALRAWWWVNPMACYVELFRQALYGAQWPGAGLAALGVGYAVVAFGVGLFVFQRRASALAGLV